MNLRCWDTGGQEKFRAITSSLYRKAEGVILVFDVCNMDSFMNLSHWKAESERFTENATMIIVAAKTDMTEKRVIPPEEVQKIGKEFKCAAFETSAKDNVGVDEAFYGLAQAMHKAYKEMNAFK